MSITQPAKEAALASHFLLRALRPQELRELAASAAVVRHPRNTVVFQKGDPGDSMMAVIRGRVKICTYSSEGRELVLNIIGAGGVFGEIALLDGKERTADAVTLEETDLLLLLRNRFLPFLAANPEVSGRLFALVCQRLRETSESLEDTLFREASSRLARGLLRLATAFGRRIGDGVRLEIRLSQQQIGSLIGISRESINKQLGEWTRAGYLSIEGGLITIRDGEALQAIALAEA